MRGMRLWGDITGVMSGQLIAYRNGGQIDLVDESLFVVIDLQIYPQIGRGAKKPAKPQRHFHGDRLSFSHNAVQRLTRDTQRLCDGRDAHQLRQRFLTQHMPRVHRRHMGKGAVKCLILGAHLSDNPLCPH